MYGRKMPVNVNQTRITSFCVPKNWVLPEGQVIGLLLLFSVGSLLILSTIKESTFNSVLLLGFVSLGGLMLCRNTQIRLNDPSLKILGYFWLIKIGLTLFLLYVGWMPQLDPSTSNGWGYDPQRFYIQSQELIDNDWSPNLLNLNYVGIIYYYGAIYYVIGHNPLIPALINAFVTLIASLYLVKVGYEIKIQRGPRDWTLAFVLLLPEMLWFDVMTSRETLVAALLIIVMLTAGRYLARTAPITLTKVLIIGGLSMFAIAAVRTSMLFPVIASIGLMVLLVKPQRGSRMIPRAILVVAIMVAAILGPVISGYLGGYSFDVGTVFQTKIAAQNNIATSADFASGWSENSIGMLLMPNSLLQSILFIPPRMVLYLVAPLPNIYFSLTELFAGSWVVWQSLFITLSSVINIIAIPYALASFIQSIKTRKNNAAPLVLHISYWVTFMAVAGGNLIIHERYRVMASLLLWGCVWLGARTCSKNLIFATSLFWYSALTLSAWFYLGYKIILA